MDHDDDTETIILRHHSKVQADHDRYMQSGL